MPRLTKAASQDMAAQLRLAGREVAPEDIQRLGEDFDFDGVVEAETSKRTVEVWDKESPINGVPAEDVLEAHASDMKNAKEVYLIKEGDRVVVFQPFSPGAGTGPMTKAKAKAEGEKQVARLAEDRATEQLVAHVRRNLRG